MKFAQWAKAYVALLGLVGVAVVGIPDIPLAWRLPLQIVVAVSGAFAVWKVENAPADPPTPPPAVAPIVAARRMVGRKAVEPPQYRLAA